MKNGVYVSVRHSLILPWSHTYKRIERPHFLGISGIGLKSRKSNDIEENLEKYNPLLHKLKVYNPLKREQNKLNAPKAYK